LSCDTNTPWFGDQLSETGDTLKVAVPRRIAPITVSFFMMSLQQQGFVRYEEFGLGQAIALNVLSDGRFAFTA
jgi:hypothetical protein